jgi:hypothetical protein
VAEEYCWAITQAAGQTCCFGVGFELDPLIYAHTFDHTYIQFRRAQN